MQDLKVLHIITRLIVGGAQENTLYTVFGQQRTAGMRVTLLSGIDAGPEGNLHEKAFRADTDLQLMPELVRSISPKIDLTALAKLTLFIRRGKYDVVHTHSSKAGILGRLAARAAGTPIVVHTLHSLVFGEHATPFQNALYIRLKKMCAPLTHRFISVCDATRLGAIAAGIGRPEQHVTIYSGFDIAPFLNIRDEVSLAEAKKRAGIPANRLVVGKVARLFAQKGHSYFLKAAQTIYAQNPKAHFLLIGDGQLRESLEAEVAQLGLTDRFSFAGLVAPEDVPVWMQAMDVVVHSSEREGLARVIPQAAAVGKPVVGFALDGTPEAIQHHVSGYLAAPRDAADLAHGVLEILARSPAERQAMGEAGRQFAAANFPTETMVQRVNQVYYDLCAQRLPGRAAS